MGKMSDFDKHAYSRAPMIMAFAVMVACAIFGFFMLRVDFSGLAQPDKPTGTGKQIAENYEIPSPSPTGTKRPDKPEPNYRATESANILAHNVMQATLEAKLAIEKSQFELRVAQDQATATQAAQQRAIAWESERATQAAQAQAKIEKIKQAQAQAELDQIKAQLETGRQLSQIEVADAAIRAAQQREWDNKMRVVRPILIGALIGILPVLFLVTYITNQRQSKKAVKTAPNKLPFGLTEENYIKILRVLQVANVSHGSSIKLPRFSDLPGVSSELRSEVANLLQDLGLAVVKPREGTYLNHRTVNDVLKLFATTPPPNKAEKENLKNNADQIR